MKSGLAFDMQLELGALAGAIVGLVLAVLGGGGSILAAPLMVYLVGLSDPHTAFGTAAVGVAASALFNLLPHAQAGHVRWRCAATFAAFGVAGAALGSSLGKRMDGHHLLALFAGLMVVVGLLMLRSRTGEGGGQITLTRANAPRLAIAGGATGALAGFFGVGGGFLIVPALVGSAGMSMTCAVGSSLVAVAAFSVTTAVNYALSGWVDWPLAACFLGGSALGGLAGVRVGAQLAARRDALRRLLVALLFAVAAYILYRALAS